MFVYTKPAPRKSQLLILKFQFSTLNSQFLILKSQLLILKSQLLILKSQLLILKSQISTLTYNTVELILKPTHCQVHRLFLNQSMPLAYL